MKWVCTKCGEKVGDGLPDDPKLAAGAKPATYGGVCPLTSHGDEVCSGKLKAYKPKAKKKS